MGIAVGDAEAAHAFYRDVLGLVPVERPDGAVAPGSWLQLGDAQVHLLERNEVIPRISLSRLKTSRKQSQ